MAAGGRLQGGGGGAVEVGLLKEGEAHVDLLARQAVGLAVRRGHVLLLAKLDTGHPNWAHLEQRQDRLRLQRAERDLAQ